MESALAALRSGDADTLIVAKLDRLSRSVFDFAGLIREAQKSGWNIVVLDLGLDLATAQGRFTAHVLSAMAELERELIGQRTKEALAVKRAQGVRLGRPSMTRPEVVARIMHMHEAGRETFSAIAASLSRDNVPTPNGGKAWYPSTVARIVARERRVVA
jgi:DNA invertase Pin-like site-specific DNA recombinase